MLHLKSIINLAFQICATFIVLFCIYMVFALFDYQGGFPNFIGLIIFHPLLGILLSTLTIFVCFLIGLPVRLNSKINSWWKSNYWLPIFGIFFGFCACFVSFFFIEEYTSRMEGMETTYHSPNETLVISGWFLISFSLMHFYFLDFVKNIARKFNLHIIPAKNASFFVVLFKINKKQNA